jgi:hypothetical protein
MGRIVLALAAVAVIGSSAWATLPQPGDIVFGLSTSSTATTLELVRGSAVLNGGAVQTSPWTSDPFIQSVEFDNFGGIAHNANGNLLGGNFGTTSLGGTILSFGTTGTDPAPAGQLLFNMDPENQVGPILPDGNPTRLGGLSVSPDNTKIAITGYDSQRLIVFDYTAGNTMGTGAPALANARHSAQVLVDEDTQGSAWLDNDTVLTFASDGMLYEVDAATMAHTLVKDVGSPVVGGEVTSIAYNPAVSPYVYAAKSSFVTATTNTLFILDPANNYNLVKTLDLSTSVQTLREIALDKDGNLFMSAFGGSSDPGGKIEFLSDVVSNPAALTDNSTVNWYVSATSSSFNGLDIGFGPEVALPGDFNGDGSVDAADYTVWRDNLGAADESSLNGNGDGVNGVDQADYDLWKSQFGAPGSGGGSLTAGAVPEPTSVMLLAVGLAAAWLGRRGWRA